MADGTHVPRSSVFRPGPEFRSHTGVGLWRGAQYQEGNFPLRYDYYVGEHYRGGVDWDPDSGCWLDMDGTFHITLRGAQEVVEAGYVDRWLCGELT